MASLVIRSAGSGEVLAELDGDGFQRMVEAHGNTVKALKLELKDKGFGCRFRLRLLNDSAEMPDDEILIPPLDLKLVRMNLCPLDKADTKALVEAARQGRLEEVETRLKKPQDPNVTNTQGWTALHFAAEHGHLECVRLLLEAGASVNQANGPFTPLFMAVQKGNTEGVRLLLEAGASSNQGRGFFNPLFVAVLEGHTEVVRLLLEAGASLNPDGDDGGSFDPLFRAVQKGHTELVHLLVEAGADCDQAHQGQGPLHIAAKQGHLEVVRILLAAGASCDLTATDNVTALLMAASEGYTEIARVLLEAGASCELATDDGKTPLHRAVAHGHVEVVRLLLEARAPDSDMMNELLELAADEGHAEMVHLLEVSQRKRRKVTER